MRTTLDHDQNGRQTTRIRFLAKKPGDLHMSEGVFIVYLDDITCEILVHKLAWSAP